MNKNITVLVAVFNKKETIKLCIDSLLNLNNPPLKIMVLDGGSTDGTYEILQSYKNKIDLFQIKIGLSARFNWALARIDTEYVALTDADCVVAKDWLDELLGGFEGKDIIATAGYCGTPQGVSFFEKIIGLELDNRFKKFPEYIVRAPTMNLCLKTKIAREIRFDKKQEVDVETDFGYRLIKKGKIRYLPEAKVFHYHRANLKGYFKQQREYAKWGLRLFSKHGKRALGDHITTPLMMIQIPIFSLVLIFFLFSLFNKSFLLLLIIFLFLLIAIYLKNIIEINPPFQHYLAFLGLFFLRNFAWLVGILEGALFFAAKSIKSYKPLL